MQPILSDSDHSHTTKTAVAGCVSVPVSGPGPVSGSVPLGAARAGVIVLHEVWGLSAPVTALVIRLADCGYIAAAPHFYHRIADPVVTDGKFTQARRYHDTLTMEGLTFDIESALAWIRAQGAQKVAVIGFSMGGALTLWVAAILHIDAAFTFSGAGLASPRWSGIPSGIDAARVLKAPWLGIYAGKDASTPARDLKRMREILTHDTTQSAVVVYPRVRHGFALEPDLPRHAADETTDAFERTSLFLRPHLR